MFVVNLFDVKKEPFSILRICFNLKKEGRIFLFNKMLILTFFVRILNANNWNIQLCVVIAVIFLSGKLCLRGRKTRYGCTVVRLYGWPPCNNEFRLVLLKLKMPTILIRSTVIPCNQLLRIYQVYDRLYHSKTLILQLFFTKIYKMECIYKGN